MKERPILFSAPSAFEVHVMPEPNSGCWLWTAALNAKGYGRFRNELAHRAAVRMDGRVIQPGFEVDHLCRNRACVNPAHLDVVTHAENIRRKSRPVMCPQGHDKGGLGKCLECDRKRNSRRYRERHPVQQRCSRKWLTPEEKALIKSLVAKGLSHSTIAPMVGVSIGTISRVRNANA